MMKTLLSKSTTKLTLIASMALMSFGAFSQVTYTDTVCAETPNSEYGITGAIGTSTYAWSLSNPAAGTIDNSITPNNGTIQIDWGVTPGTYTLYAVETTGEGCIGDTVTLDVVINPLPTVAVVSDSVCEGFSATLTFTLTGTGPWVIDYTDGTTNFTETANASPHVVSLPAYTASQSIVVTGLTDDNGCDGDAAGLPTVPVVIFPKPATGAIFHY